MEKKKFKDKKKVTEYDYDDDMDPLIELEILTDLNEEMDIDSEEKPNEEPNEEPNEDFNEDLTNLTPTTNPNPTNTQPTPRTSTSDKTSNRTSSKTQPQDSTPTNTRPVRESTKKLAGNYKQLATGNSTKPTKEKNCDNCRYTSEQLLTAKKQIKELEKELEKSTKEMTQQKKDALKTTEKTNNEIKTLKLRIIDLKTQDRETQEKLQSISEQLDSTIERLTKREDEINKLQRTLTNRPQPTNINQQQITKHKEEITNLTNIIEEKDTIIDQLIDYKIQHKQQPTAQPQPQQKTKRILLMGDSNATTINQHLHNKPTTTYRLKTTFNLNELHQQIQEDKDDINDYDNILVLIGTHHLKQGQQASDIHRDITAITQPLDQNKLLIIEPPRLSNTNHEIERKTLIKLHKNSNQKIINPYPINLILKPDGIHLTDDTAQQTANELMRILEMEPTQEPQKTITNKTNTTSARPKTQQPQQSLLPQPSHQAQPQRSHQSQLSYQPPSNQPTDREDQFIKEEFKISNNIVPHVIGKEGKNIRHITSKNHTRAHYNTKTETMTITGIRRRDIRETIEDIKEIVETRTQEQEIYRPTPRNPTYQLRPTQHEPQHNRPRHEEERYTYSRRAEIRELREPPHQYRDRSPHHHQEFRNN